MNYSVFHFSAARLGAELVLKEKHNSNLGVDIAVVFSFMAIEALVNEQALFAVHYRGVDQERVYDADRTQGSVPRIQALLGLVFGGELDLSQGPGQDFQHLVIVRDGLVHYDAEVKGRLKQTLHELSRRSPPLFDDDEAAEWPAGWPVYVRPEMATWAVETTALVAHEIADIMGTRGEAEMTRVNFPKQLA